MPKVLRLVGIAAAVVGVSAAVLYGFGMRVVLLGGGRPSIEFAQSADAQADAIAQHRAAQAAAPEPSLAPAAESPVPAPTDDSSPAVEVAMAPDWGFFRGMRWDGHYTAQPIRTDWPNGQLTPLWKQPVGGGYASFVTARIGDRDTAFTIEQRGRTEVVAAYDVSNGRELWTNTWNAEFRESMGGDGPRATPTYHDGRIYALGGAGELRSIDASTGTTAWRTNILSDAGASNIEWGMSASPLIVDDAVVTLPGGRGGKSIVAYNHRTGARLWSSLDDKQSYSSPMLVTVDGVRQILTVSASRIMGLNPGNGALLWEFPWKTMYDVNAGQPIVLGTNRVFMSSGYDHGAVVIEVAMAGERGTVKEIWQNNRMKNQFTSSVHHEGFIYGLDENILACVDANTGALQWKGGRYGHGQIVLASGHIIVLTESGELALVKADPSRHIELANFPAIEGKTWNHPAFSNGRLLVRNLREMAAFDLRLPSLTSDFLEPAHVGPQGVGHND